MSSFKRSPNLSVFVSACIFAVGGTASCTAAADSGALKPKNQGSHVMEKTIKFVPGKSYEVTGIWVKPGKMQQLNEYFGKIFPYAAKTYGIKPIVSFVDPTGYSGEFIPHIMFLNEWPSVDSFKKFVADPKAVALFPERDDAVFKLVVSQYEVPKEVEITVKEGDTIEFAGIWLKPGKEEQFKTYYQSVVPIAMQNGMKPVTPLKLVHSYSGDFAPHIAGLNYWGKYDNFRSFIKQAQPHLPLRDEAVSRLSVTHAKIHFEGAR